MAQRCKKLGISCVEWQSRRPPDAAAVVLVTPESAVGEEFATFLNRLRATRQLDRIIIDECHIVLNRQYTFRKQMQQLGKLVAVETQMVMLTATLPPSEEDELFQRMHFERRQVRIFRAPTARSNIAYRVVRVEKERKRGEVEASVLEMVRQKVAKYKTGKIVVYGNSVPKVKGLAEKLKCHAYHHHAVGKASMLEEFMGVKQRVIVATSALGMGVDVPDIRYIVHMDWPFSVLDYAQESGRDGRDGERSEAIMMAQDGEQRAADDKQGEAEQRLVRAYVEGIDEAATCRRVVLDGYLDRREAERARGNIESCNVDEGSSNSSSRSDSVSSDKGKSSKISESVGRVSSKRDSSNSDDSSSSKSSDEGEGSESSDQGESSESSDEGESSESSDEGEGSKDIRGSESSGNSESNESNDKDEGREGNESGESRRKSEGRDDGESSSDSESSKSESSKSGKSNESEAGEAGESNEMASSESVGSERGERNKSSDMIGSVGSESIESRAYSESNENRASSESSDDGKDSDEGENSEDIKNRRRGSSRRP
ncbi:ATP-dependent DNA helicase recQ [Pyrenophora tritici-repentis]|nr:ATP-dependent DNA helicase recQ [Pyrenophora tritici-repentis]